MNNAFNQIRVAKGQEWLTAIRTRRGCFQIRVMPFGFKNSPATFQRVIDEALSDLSFSCAIAYINNILINSPDKKTHAQDLFKFVSSIHTKWLLIKPIKCELFQSKVAWLVKIVISKSHAVSLSKKDAILNWATPPTQKKLS